MNVEYIYDGPDYDNVVKNDLKFIKEILEKKTEYWLKESGDSSISLDDNKTLLFFKTNEGVFIEILPNSKSPLINENSEIKEIIQYIGGEPAKFPNICFCDISTALSIIRYFIYNNGELNPDFEWIDIFDYIPNPYKD